MFSIKVDNLKEKLAIQEVELKIKNDAADKLIQIVGIETEKVSKEKAFGINLFKIEKLIMYFYTYLILIKISTKQLTKKKKKYVQ